jgi:hypothetical protein
MKYLLFLLFLFLITTIIADESISMGNSVSVSVKRANHFNNNYLLIFPIGIIFGFIYYFKKRNKNKEVLYE